jgi:hypothetical protein
MVKPLHVLSSNTIASMINSENKTTTFLQCSDTYKRKRWGIDNEYSEEYWDKEYWFDDRIHTLGNV